MQHPNTFVRVIALKRVHSRRRRLDPFGQPPESQPLAGFDFLSMLRVFVSYSQPIRFVRFVGFDGNLRIEDIQFSTHPEVGFVCPGQKDSGL